MSRRRARNAAEPDQISVSPHNSGVENDSQSATPEQIINLSQDQEQEDGKSQESGSEQLSTRKAKTKVNRKKQVWGWIIKISLMVIMLSITCLLMYIFNTDHPYARDTVMFIIRSMWAAPFILVGINILITLFFLPGIFGALLCGYAYCFLIHNFAIVLLVGTATCFVGFSIGSIMAMYIGRYFAKSCVVKLAEGNKYLRALSKCIEHDGLKVLVMLRLSPLVPYNVLNYLVGAYPVKLCDFAIANFAMIPGILVYVYIGTAVSSIGALFDSPSGGNLIKIILLSVGILFAIGAIIVIWLYTKRHLNKVVAQLEAESANTSRVEDCQESEPGSINQVDGLSPNQSDLEVQDPNVRVGNRMIGSRQNSAAATMWESVKIHDGRSPMTRAIKEENESDDEGYFKRGPDSESKGSNEFAIQRVYESDRAIVRSGDGTKTSAGAIVERGFLSSGANSKHDRDSVEPSES